MNYSRYEVFYGLALIVAGGCAGDGSSFSEVEEAVTGNCGRCHDATGFERLVDDVLRVDPQVFDATRFTDEMFPNDLRRQSTTDLIAAANPERDANIDPETPVRQAWILHLLHVLDEQLRAEPSSDFTMEDSFNGYIASGTPPAGCTVIDRVETLVEFDLPQQMPPLWSAPLFEALDSPFAELSPEDRILLVQTIEAGLPDGRAACLLF